MNWTPRISASSVNWHEPCHPSAWQEKAFKCWKASLPSIRTLRVPIAILHFSTLTGNSATTKGSGSCAGLSNWIQTTPRIRTMNAVMHWRLGDYDNTALWMNNIARLVPNPEVAPVYRGWAFIAQRDFEGARGEFEHSEFQALLSTGSAFFTWEASIRRKVAPMMRSSDTRITPQNH